MQMYYVSTRGRAEKLKFDDVLLAGMASDGGLYVPEEYPYFTKQDIREMRGLSYQELAVKILSPFVEEVIPEKDLKEIVNKAYSTFVHDSVAPLKQLGANLWLMELFHGPTLAFKDCALQLVGHLFDYVLAKKDERVTIVGATSGDTGSAAIEACRDRDCIDIFILHPHNRVSEVQRKQMTTVASSNVYNIALKGNFDDCQNMVKAMFADAKFRKEMKLSAVNSINWARIMAQVVYYFWAGISLGAPDNFTSFAVPTGNFGNVFAGYVAMKMGLPIGQLIIGSNANDILPRFFKDGKMEQKGVVASISPSMDIQISSNFERFLFELCDRDSEKLVSYMDKFKSDGEYKVSPEMFERACNVFGGFKLDDAQTKAFIKEAFQKTGELLDPHSAIGVKAGVEVRQDKETPVVCLATAHPAKFPDAVESATGIRPGLPKKMSDLFDREEKFVIKSNQIELIEDFVSQNTKANK
jgi:threonine synthase